MGEMEIPDHSIKKLGLKHEELHGYRFTGMIFQTIPLRN